MAQSVKYACVKGSKLGSAVKAAAMQTHVNWRSTYKAVARFICTTEFMVNTMRSAGFDSSKLTRISTFIPDTEVIENVQALSDFRVEDTPRSSILYFGRFAPEKGVEDLIEVFIKRRFWEHDVNLQLVGGTVGDLDLKWSKTIMDKLINDGRLSIKPFVTKSELNRYLDEALVVVHPTRWFENLPNSVLEAMARGVPIITSDLGSMPEFVHHRVNGLLYKPNDLEGLGDSLEYCLRHRDEVRAMGERANRFVVENFSANDHLTNLMTVFDEVSRRKQSSEFD